MVKADHLDALFSSNQMKLRLLDTVSRSLGMTITSSTCLTTGADILTQQGATQSSKWNCLRITVGFGSFLGYCFTSVCCLGARTKVADKRVHSNAKRPESKHTCIFYV